MRGTNTGQSPWNDLPALRHKLSEQPNILVIDGLDLLHAELANFLAPEILAAAFAPTRASRPTRTRWTTFSAVGAISARRAVSAGGMSSRRRCCCSFVSHVAPSIKSINFAVFRDYAVTAAVSPPVSAGAGGGAGLRRASRIFLILSNRFCSSSMRTVRNLITGSVTRRRRSNS